MADDPANADPSNEPDSLQEQLVAYLDGELDQESSRRVEELLAADPKVREALRGLERTWELLDDLGRAEVDESFTHTTLEMVSLAAEADVQQYQTDLPRRHRRRWLIGGASLTAAALAGFLLLGLLWPGADDQLLEDLPVVENLDQYRQAGDVEFLRLLLRDGLFAKEAADGR